MEIKAKAKRWGSSIGIVLPKSIVESKKIRENDEVIIEIKKSVIAGEVFGRFAGRFKKSTQELKDDARKGWD